MTDWFSVLAIEKSRRKEGSFREMGLFPSIFVAERTKCLGWVGRISEYFKKKRQTFSRKSPTFFQKSPTFLWESPTFLWKCRIFFARFLSSVLGLKIVLIFCCSVKVVKAKSAKVQGCARVSPAYNPQNEKLHRIKTKSCLAENETSPIKLHPTLAQ